MNKTATLICDNGCIQRVLIQQPDDDYVYFITGGKGKIFHTFIDGKDAIIWDQDDIIENLENLSMVKANKLFPFIQGNILILN